MCVSGTVTVGAAVCGSGLKYWYGTVDVLNNMRIWATRRNAEFQ